MIHNYGGTAGRIDYFQVSNRIFKNNMTNNNSSIDQASLVLNSLNFISENDETVSKPKWPDDNEQQTRTVR